MITIPTVLVLGAGASYYGISDGKGGEASGYSPDGFFRFRETFWKSGQPSVDAFPEWRPDFLAIGKLAIAYCLLPFEDESKLFTPPGNRDSWAEAHIQIPELSHMARGGRSITRTLIWAPRG